MAALAHVVQNKVEAVYDFPANGRWYLSPHDELVQIAGETPWLQSQSGSVMACTAATNRRN